MIFAARWQQPVEKGFPEPGDEVTHDGDIFQVLNVERHPTYGKDVSVNRADLIVESVHLSKPYDQNNFFVEPI
jgi:hypothetical protein